MGEVGESAKHEKVVTQVVGAEIHYHMKQKEKAMDIASKAVEVCKKIDDSRAEVYAVDLLNMIYAEQAPMMGQYQLMEYYDDAAGGQSIQAAQKEGLDPKAVAEKVMEAARSVIGLEDDSVHMDSPLMETGMDS